MAAATGKKLNEEQLNELRAQLKKVDALRAYYEAHPDDPDAFAAFAKNAAKVDAAGLAQIDTADMARAGTAGLATSGGAAAAAGIGLTKTLFTGFALGGPIGMVAAATFQAVRQASRNRRQNPELCEAYDRVAEAINTHDTGRLSFTSEQKEAFVDAQNYATGRSGPRDMSDKDVDRISPQLEAMYKDLKNEIVNTRTSLSNQISELSAQLQPCRELARGILDSLPDGEEDSSLAERLYALATDISVRALEKQYESGNARDADALRGELKALFDPIWEKLRTETQKELFTAKLCYQQLTSGTYPDSVDFSCVCMLASKAMELECEKYFYRQFRRYIFEQTPEIQRDAAFADALELTQEAQQENRRRGGFTLGSVPYILHPTYGDEELRQRYLRVLTAYARERLFSEDAKRELRDDRQIQARLQEYAGYVKKVKDQYRNPSVHKEIIRQRDALACLDYVVDVEKKLKIMVSAFRG